MPTLDWNLHVRDGRMAQMQNSLIIQALRGLAAIAVVIFHQETLLEAYPTVHAVVSHCYLGVDLFFVISGFVIGVSTNDEAKPSVPVFLVRRVFRIVPLAWTVLALQLLVVHADLGLIVRGLFFLPENPPASFPLNPPQWTLSYEFCFYAIFALAIGLSHRLRCEISVGIVAVLALLDWILPASGTPLRSFLNSDLLLEFAAGVVLAKCLLAAPPNLSWKAVVALASASILCGLTLFWTRPVESGLSSFGGEAALVLAGLLLIERYRPVRIPWTLVQLGELSYAIYICQHFAFIYAGSTVFWTPLHKTWIYTHTAGASRLALLLVVVLAIATLLHVAVERPGIRLGRRLARQIGQRSRPQVQLENA